MKRKFTLILALFFVLIYTLSGCSSVLVPSDEREQLLLRLSIQKGIPQEASDGLDVFISQVEKLSEGKIKIEKSMTDDPLTALDKGSDIIFASNSEITRGNGDFLSFTSPFYFSDYTHMTVTLNGEPFKKLIGDRTESLIGAYPLAAFYGGSRVIISNEKDTLDIWDEWENIKISISPDNELLDVALKGLNAIVNTENIDEMVPRFINAKLRTVECEPIDLMQISDNMVKTAYICVYDSFHAPKIHWMMVNTGKWEALDDYARAVITDAAAKALAVNDEAVLGQEKRCFDYVMSIDIPVYEMDYEDFAKQIDSIYQSSVRYRNLWDWQIHDNIRSITSKQQALLTIYE